MRTKAAGRRGLDDMSVVSGNERIDQFLAVRSQRRQRAFLVRAHETRVARHVGDDDRSEMTLDRARRHSRDPFSLSNLAL
jgi:hypothetical protein